MKPSQVSIRLRQIAAKIDRSRQPDQRLVTTAIKQVLANMMDESALFKGKQIDNPAINVCRTNDSEMDAPSEFKRLKKSMIVSYLNQNPRNAVVIDKDGVQIAVFRGASDEPNNFYTQVLPLEDPNDADGGEYTAEQAIDFALTY